MTAHHLRTAAAKLREVAGDVTPGPWHVAQQGPYVRNERNYVADTTASQEPCGDAQFIATMSPPVALAMAGWLEREARIWDEGVRLELEASDQGANYTEALAVANAVLADQDVAV